MIGRGVQAMVRIGGAAMAAVLAAAPLATRLAAQERGIGTDYPSGQGGSGGITVWTEANFRGRSRTIATQLPTLDPYGFGGNISSFRVARGEVWEGCDQKNYKGTCTTFWGEERDLGPTGWNDRLRSLRRRSGGGGWGGSGGSGGGWNGTGIEIYYDDDYRGGSRNFSGATNTTGIDRAGSLRVRGRWEVCGQPYFRGACTTVSGDVRSISRDLGLSTIRSARPR